MAASASAPAPAEEEELPPPIPPPSIATHLALWAPGAREGHTCLYSRERKVAVLFGGLRPGFGAALDMVECSLSTPSAGALTAVAWNVLKVSNVPKRCYHGAALHEASQQLVIFGGQAANAKGGSPECMNDTWRILLRNSVASPVIGDEGVPPTPRCHHTLSAISLDGGSGSGGGRGGRGGRGGSVSYAGDGGAFLVAVLGGVNKGTLAKKEDCVHLLHIDADGSARWTSGAAALTAAAAAHVRAHPPVVSEMAKANARRNGDEAAATHEAVRREERRLRSERGESYTLLERYSHTSCVERQAVIVFGGRTAVKNSSESGASDALLRFDTETLECSAVEASGERPAARYGHAAVVVGRADGLAYPGRAMLVHGGQDGARLLSDVHVLHLPAMAWASLPPPAPHAGLAPLRAGGDPIPTEAEFARLLVRHSHSLCVVDGLPKPPKKPKKNDFAAPPPPPEEPHGPLLMAFGGYGDQGYADNTSLLLRLPSVLPAPPPPPEEVAPRTAPLDLAGAFGFGAEVDLDALGTALEVPDPAAAAAAAEAAAEAAAAEAKVEALVDMQQAFLQFDRDGDGTITTKELGAALRKLGMTPSEDELQELIDQVDADGSGVLEFDEFCSLVSCAEEQARWRRRAVREIADAIVALSTGCALPSSPFLGLPSLLHPALACPPPHPPLASSPSQCLPSSPSLGLSPPPPSLGLSLPPPPSASPLLTLPRPLPSSPPSNSTLLTLPRPSRQVRGGRDARGARGGGGQRRGALAAAGARRRGTRRPARHPRRPRRGRRGGPRCRSDRRHDGRAAAGE